MVDTGSSLTSFQRFLLNGMGTVEVPQVYKDPSNDVPVVLTSGLLYDSTNDVYYMGYTGSTWVKLGSIA